MNTKKFANLKLYTDVIPYEVIREVSPITLEVRRMDAKLIEGPKNFQVGGFAAHCVDNHNQKYNYTSNTKYPLVRIRFSKKRNGWYSKGSRFILSDVPVYFYDYNFQARKEISL